MSSANSYGDLLPSRSRDKNVSWIDMDDFLILPEHDEVPVEGLEYRFPARSSRHNTQRESERSNAAFYYDSTEEAGMRFPITLLHLSPLYSN